MNRDRLRGEARRRSAKRRAADPEEQRRKKREWYRKTPEKQREYKERRRAANSARELERYHVDIDYKLRLLLRNRLRSAIRNSAKSGSAIRDLGCTIDELKAHLESLFADDMAWDNWGHTGDVWHIDHIIPLASFDLTDRDQLLAACHYTNLQPLWATENLQKGARR